MRALIAEDNSTTRLMLSITLSEWGYEVVTASDGAQAWDELQKEDAPRLVLLDWRMPRLDGIEVCRLLRTRSAALTTYVIMLTARGSREDIVAGLDAGADEYITKPFDPAELEARLRAGARIVSLQKSLAERVRELEHALTQVKQLRGLLPICAYCKKIRDDQNYWQQVESYLCAHSDVQFTHGVCPDCYEHVVKPEIEAVRRQQLPSGS